MLIVRPPLAIVCRARLYSAANDDVDSERIFRMQERMYAFERMYAVDCEKMFRMQVEMKSVKEELQSARQELSRLAVLYEASVDIMLSAACADSEVRRSTAPPLPPPRARRSLDLQ